MHTSRRGFLELAALGLAGTSIGAGGATLGQPKNLIVMYAYGGWDVAMGLDPKPGLSTVWTLPGRRASVGDIDFFESDAQTGAVRSYFERHGAATAVLRGVNMLSLSHEICTRYALAGSSGVEAPDVAAITGYALSPERPLPYLILGDRALTGTIAGSAGRVGLNNQLGTLLDPSTAWPPMDRVPALDSTDQDLVRGWVTGRLERARPRYAPAGSRSAARFDDFARALERGDLLYQHAAAFTGEATLDNQVDLAIYALSHQMSRAALVDSRMNWDSHIEIEQQLDYHDSFFASLDRLMTELASTPGAEPGSTLLDETLVLSVSEMARTPLMNDIGGKDHWPHTAAMVAGGMVRGGRVYGATDENLVALPIDLTTGELDPNGRVLAPAELLAGVLSAVGVKAEDWLPGVTPYTGPFAG